jgi:hypothetical protein
MANTYECSVNKAHKREVTTVQSVAPTCCGKPMSQVQTGTSQPAASAAKPAGPTAPTATQGQKPVASAQQEKK